MQMFEKFSMISVEIDNTPDVDWNDRLKNSKFGSIYQTTEYAQYVELQLKLKPIFLKFVQNGEIIAQLLIFQSFKGRRKLAKYFGRGTIYSITSKVAFVLPKYINWNYGPVIFKTEFTNQILDKFGNLLISWNSKFDGSVHPLDYNCDFPERFSFRRNNFGTFVIDLNQDLEKILSNTDKKSVQKNIERSQERGVTITEIKLEKDIIIYYELLNKHRESSNLILYSKQDVVNGFKMLKPVGQKGFLAWHNNTPVGGIMFSSFNRYINEWGIARSKIDTELKLYSLDLLRWKIIEWGVQNDCLYYDLTGVKIENRSSKEESLFRNKSKWGGRLISYMGFSN